MYTVSQLKCSVSGTVPALDKTPPYSTAVQIQMAVSAYFTSKQIYCLLGFVEQRKASRWLHIKTTSGQCLVFAGWAHQTVDALSSDEPSLS